MAMAAQVRDVQLGSPAGFAIFSGTEYEDENTAALCYYFSPVAATSCADILAPFSPIPCDVPDPDDPKIVGFGLTYGTLQGSGSWDLLK
ncbi:MAG: hypothetical protein AUG51_08735 [Acidobacteria bacterium 13_1_20CM_3_53_8]|nr:MAG: hypothetical protein AUG51_08735 [Acidobacteria bacterium 13_1_20CM_3_53_8]